MAGKPELSAAPGVQNVLVYVSNDNYAQAYTVGPQNVAPNVHNSGYANQIHSVAPLGAPEKGGFPDKQHHIVEANSYNSQAGYFTNQAVISQNGFPQPVVGNIGAGGYKNIGVENGAVLGAPGVKGAAAFGNEVVLPDRTLRTDIAKECAANGDYAEPNYVVMGGEGTSVRCDSVRSEAAESSCSSLSSADEGMLVVPQQEMVVYDNSVNVRHGVVVAVGGPHQSASAPNVGSIPNPVQTVISVPYGWKRLSTNGVVIYISPSNAVLSSPDQVKEYLLTPGTCKCGLECPLKYDSVFNFDPKVIGKPWTLTPDTNTGDLTKLCNHKRKMIAMASLGCKPPDPNKIPKVSQMQAQREKMASQPYIKENVGSPPFPPSPQPQQQHQLAASPQQQQQHQQQQQQMWHGQLHQQPPSMQHHHHQQQELQQPGPIPQNNPQFFRYQNQEVQHRMGSPVVLGDGSVVMQPGPNQNISHMQIQQQQQPPPHPHHQPNLNQPQIQLQHQHQQIIGPNGQVINVNNGQMGMGNLVNNGMVIQGPNQQRVFVNGQPTEPSGPGRPVQMIPVSISTNRPEINHRIPQQQPSPQQQAFFNQNYPAILQQQPQQFDPTKTIRPFTPTNGFRQNPPLVQSNNIAINQKIWNPRVPLPSQSPQSSNVYERVPPLHQHQPPPTVWQDEINRKKIKSNKTIKKRPFNMIDGSHRTTEGHPPCPNIDVRQIPNESQRNIMINQFQNEQNQTSSPSFLEDPSGYLAQQTALLNSTINRQTGANGCSNYICNSPVTSVQNQIMTTSQPNGVPLPSNIQMKQQQTYGGVVRNQHNMVKSQINNPPQYNQVLVTQGMPPDSSAMNDLNCQGCTLEYQQNVSDKEIRVFPRPSSQPSTPSSTGTGEDPVTSSNYMDKHHPSPDSRPIQGGTVSTSNVSPVEGSPDPSASHTPTPPHQEILPQVQIPYNYQPEPNQNAPSAQFHIQQNNQNMPQTSYHKQEVYCHPHISSRGIVTTMASGRTVGSNTITSVLAGRANTATVSITNPVTSNHQIPNQNGTHTTTPQIPASKSPLEMVQSVVSSIKVPHSQPNVHQVNVQNIPQQVVKQGLPPGHIFVSSGGQLIMASTNSGHVMPPPPPPKIVTNQTSMPPISVSPMITNVTAAVTQMIPAVAQQVLGQQTVLVNALPAPFVLQPGVTMTMDGMNMQIPHLVTGNVIQQQIQIDNSDPRRVASLLSPENKKKGKKRKVSPQTVASMLHIAAQQNSGVVGFPQQIQMAHSPQGITGPMMQALTIVPGKAGGPHQIVMNGQLPNTQQIINSQSQQINLLQPVNLAQGMMQNFPTIQQFVVPNLTGMVMNADGTATIVQDTNIGMQLQLQNVNGQNVLTPVQNNQMFTSGQSIIPTGMVIRPQGKIIQQQHSPGAQFLSPNGGGQFVAQFNGQLSPLVANVSPGQQVTFSTGPQIRPNNTVQQPQQEYIQCGQTLMVPANITASNSNQQNTTFVQQNTTIVQQQTTMLSNNQNNQNQTLNVDQNFIISDKQAPVQTVVLQQRQSPLQQLAPNYRHSVSTQTAVNQNGQTVTTNTFCQTSTSNAGSPPDTTTHSPLASGGQSPPTADTTTHSGSTDDGLSPAPSNCSGSCGDIVNLQTRQQSSMAMVHCISSSEPDSAEMTVQNREFDWRNVSMSTAPKMEFTDISSAGHVQMKKSTTPAHMAYAESSTMMHFTADTMKQQDAVVSSRNYEKIQHKRKHSDTLVVMETRHMHSSLFDDEDDEQAVIKGPHTFIPGDLVWGPARGCPAWPGKLLEVKQESVTVRWFGGDKSVGEVNPAKLRTLTEGLEAHHRAGKKSRTSRKLNAQLEKAIQEAMTELDRMSSQQPEEVAKKTTPASSSAGRLRSGQR